MFKALSEKLILKVIANDIIKKEDADEYIYGINAFLTTMLNILSAFIIGIVLQMPLEIILYISVYKFLRKYVGGMHAKTAYGCYISSCAIYVVTLFIIKNYPFSITITTLMVIISAIVMILIAPVAALNKPLDDIEVSVFRFRARRNIFIILFFYLLLSHVLFLPFMQYASYIIAVSVITVAIFAVIGRISLLRRR